MNTYELLDKLEELVDKKSRQIMHKAILDVDEFFDLLGSIRTSLPDDVKTASRITREADQIVDTAKEQAAQSMDQAKAESARIIEDARMEAERLVDANEITRLASAQAKDIVVSAEQEAKGVKAGADEYAREVLSELDDFVSRVQGTIRHGRDKLEHKVSTGSENE
ncbi:MAG: ATP synthase subunit B family protein [Armatimonadota bacterium]